MDGGGVFEEGLSFKDNESEREADQMSWQRRPLNRIDSFFFFLNRETAAKTDRKSTRDKKRQTEARRAKWRSLKERQEASIYMTRPRAHHKHTKS